MILSEREIPRLTVPKHSPSIGTPFGDWVTISDAYYPDPKYPGEPRYLTVDCRCQCGTERPKVLNDLRRGMSEGCRECLKVRRARKQALEFGGDSFSMKTEEAPSALTRGLRLCDPTLFALSPERPARTVKPKVSKGTRFNIDDYQLPIGESFGYWEVTGPSEPSGGVGQFRAVVPVKCTCGCETTTLKRYHSLMSGETTGCSSRTRKRS